MIKKKKSWNEAFAKFFESPSREGLRNLLRDHLGETHAFDFKEIWLANSKLSRQILGLANYGGGCLIVGVQENDDKSFTPVGLGELSDKTEIEKGIEKFIPVQLEYEIIDFSYQDSEYKKLKGRKYQVLIVEDSPKHLPFLAMADGDGIRKNAIYYRHATNTEEINYGELQNILNRRIETEFSTKPEFDLQKHLDQLKVLYRNIRPLIKYYHYEETEEDFYEQEFSNYSIGGNPNYPRESIEEFIKKLIIEKKKLINVLTTK
jgi:predicted HTH transcriptional regulator